MINMFYWIFDLFAPATLELWIPLAAICVLALCCKLIFARSRYNK